MSTMRAVRWARLVRMPACAPVSEIAGVPAAWSAMASSGAVIVSPLLSSMSISRDGGSPVTRWASAISSSVVSPMALTTTTISVPASIDSRMRRATRRSFIGVATLEPPYLCTTRVTPTRPP